MSKKPVEISDTELKARELHRSSLLSFMSWDDISAASRQEFMNDVLRGVEVPAKKAVVIEAAVKVAEVPEVVVKAPPVVAIKALVIDKIPAKAPTKTVKVKAVKVVKKTTKKTTKKAKTVKKIDPSLTDDEKKALRKKLRVRKQIAKNKKAKKLAAKGQ